jgi:hypothetical protein
MLNVSAVYKSGAAAIGDQVISALFSWNRQYHGDAWWKKLAPGSVFYLLIPAGGSLTDAAPLVGRQCEYRAVRQELARLV